jgi:lipopolysaccharide heptosyltransferase I
MLGPEFMINGVPRILIIRLSAIGDVVRVLPALHALRNRYPNAQIDWAVEQKSYEIVSGHPELDQIHVFERGEGGLENTGGFLAFCKIIRDAKYDWVIDFHGILKSGMITRASGAKQRYGFARPRAQEGSFLTTNRKVPLVSKFMNRIEENLELVKVVEAKAHSLDVTIDIPEDVEDTIEAYFHETFHGAKKVVVVHAPVDRPEKQWPIEFYAQLADMIMRDGRYEVLLTWGPDQRETVDAVLKLTHNKPHLAPETPDLKHYAALVAQCDLYFGGDTGPMHIASAMGLPVVAVFGGTHPAQHAPLRKPSRVLYAGPDIPVRSIDRENADAQFREITPEMAYDVCVDELHG